MRQTNLRRNKRAFPCRISTSADLRWKRLIQKKLKIPGRTLQFVGATSLRRPACPRRRRVGPATRGRGPPAPPWTAASAKAYFPLPAYSSASSCLVSSVSEVVGPQFGGADSPAPPWYSVSAKAVLRLRLRTARPAVLVASGFGVVGPQMGGADSPAAPCTSPRPRRTSPGLSTAWPGRAGCRVCGGGQPQRGVRSASTSLNSGSAKADSPGHWYSKARCAGWRG